jgi:hypothetical protein
MKLLNIANWLKRAFKEDYKSKPVVHKKGMCIHEVFIWGIPYKERKTVVQQLTLMEKLKFRRDSTYKYDKNAISVMTSNEEIIGYLPPHITKVLTPINDRDLDFDNTIIRLEKDHADQKYSVQVAIYLPEKLIPSVSQQPEFIIDKGSRGDLYILLNCSSDVCDNIINQLEQKNLNYVKWGQSIQLGSDGRQYQWFIRMYEEIEEKIILDFFQEYYALSPWERVDDYIEEFGSEIKTKDEKIEIIKDKLHQAKSELNKEKKKYKKDVEKALKKIIHQILSDIKLCKNSWDVILKETPKPERIFRDLQRIQSDKNIKAERVKSTNNWKELKGGYGQRGDDRIYFKRSGNGTDVLISYKKIQKKDIHWMRKND